MFKRSLESLVAGVCVYAAMAACSGGGTAGSPAGSGDAGGPVASEGGQPAKGGAKSPAEAGEGMAGGPVPNAMAAGNGGGEGECGCQPVEPKGPTIVEAECEEFPGLATMWAIAEVPASDVDLSKVVAIVEYPEGINKTPPGFDSYAATVYLKNGAVATTCGPVSTPGLRATRVRFVLP